MPELPEVETIKRVLQPHLVGRKIKSVIVHNDRIVAYPQAELFALKVSGQMIANFTRRGKFLSLHFLGGDTVVLHLRMTGALTLSPPSAPVEKHTHLIFVLDDEKELRYEDARRFGRFWFIENGTEDTISGKSKLGIEPFDSRLTAAYLRDRLIKSKRPIKEALLDQGLFAGIGNIYADEILFTAKIRPDKAVCTLTDDDFARLLKAIPERLEYFIEKNEISFEAYLKSKGKEYRNTPYLQVYGKAGRPCACCGAELCHTVIGGRSSVYCPNCQK